MSKLSGKVRCQTTPFVARTMATYDPSKVRNVAIIAHVDHGEIHYPLNYIKYMIFLLKYFRVVFIREDNSHGQVVGMLWFLLQR